jgi:hypothetical protein
LTIASQLRGSVNPMFLSIPMPAVHTLLAYENNSSTSACGRGMNGRTHSPIRRAAVAPASAAALTAPTSPRHDAVTSLHPQRSACQLHIAAVTIASAASIPTRPLSYMPTALDIGSPLVVILLQLLVTSEEWPRRRRAGANAVDGDYSPILRLLRLRSTQLDRTTSPRTMT